MKDISRAAELLAQTLELPEEALTGAAKLSVTAGKRALVENHRGILSYGEERIVLRVARGKLCINGSGLRLLAMTEERIYIGGRIQCVEWE